MLETSAVLGIIGSIIICGDHILMSLYHFKIIEDEKWNNIIRTIICLTGYSFVTLVYYKERNRNLRGQDLTEASLTRHITEEVGIIEYINNQRQHNEMTPLQNSLLDLYRRRRNLINSF